jgi:5'-methylthioadenosine phosphorylase
MAEESRASLGVIGGSGFYQIDGLKDMETVVVQTPFGPASDSFLVGRLGNVRVAFLPRHGAGHRLAPHEVPQRANIWGFAALGVRQLISISAVGSLREEIAPLHIVIPDQIIDRTRRLSTFFEGGIVGHIAFDAPFCPTLSRVLADAVEGADVEVHRRGTLVVIDGPAFSTRAESELYRAWGADIIGMTAAPEAKLAREAGMCYATLACVTDYDTWHATEEKVSVELILANLSRNVANARKAVVKAAASLPEWQACTCPTATRNAVVTPLDLVPEETKARLGPILERIEQVAGGY